MRVYIRGGDKGKNGKRSPIGRYLAIRPSQARG